MFEEIKELWNDLDKVDIGIHGGVTVALILLHTVAPYLALFLAITAFWYMWESKQRVKKMQDEYNIINWSWQARLEFLIGPMLAAIAILF